MYILCVILGLKDETDFTIHISEKYREVINLDVIRSGYSYGSDHYSFWIYDYNAIFYHEYRFNSYWHQPEDTIDKMDINYATRTSRLIVATLGELSRIGIINPPDKPSQPVGVINARIRREHVYSSSTIDPDGDQVYYMWDWGDGSFSDWLGPYDSGNACETSHKWREKGSYVVMVMAKDVYGIESEWSDPLSINVPKYKSYNNPTFQNFLEQHPHLFPILRGLL